MALTASTVGPYFASGSISFSQLRSNFKETSSGEVKASELLRVTDTTNTDPIVPDATENSNIATSINLKASQFRNSSLDFVLIDAGHSYTDVTNDLNYWYKKLKPGGYFAGDDYGTNIFTGVTKAVDEFFYNQITSQGWNWIRRKPRIQIKHLMTKPNDLREIISHTSLRQLEKYGMVYENTK